jgi:hypothetical protein
MASARSTDSMARTTPAQNPRGEQSSTFRTGLAEFAGIINLKGRGFGAQSRYRHGVRRPTLSSGTVA